LITTGSAERSRNLKPGFFAAKAQRPLSNHIYHFDWFGKADGNSGRNPFFDLSLGMTV
jgi:hypothetical protein